MRGDGVKWNHSNCHLFAWYMLPCPLFSSFLLFLPLSSSFLLAAWASSGINGVRGEGGEDGSDAAKGAKDPLILADPSDSIKAFADDMATAGGREEGDPRLELVRALTDGSGAALQWLGGRVGIHLNQVGQLGGHSRARTYRPSEGLTGMELINALQKQIDTFKESGRLVVRKKARVTRIMRDTATGRVVGVEYEDLKMKKKVTKEKEAAAKAKASGKASGGATAVGESTAAIFVATIKAHHVVIATGGFAANDRSPTSLIKRYRPDLESLATTNGRWANGDGHLAAMEVGADTVEMDHVQVRSFLYSFLYSFV